MTFVLDCHPPTTTAQMKRVRVVNGKPRFFHGAKMQKQARDWQFLLAQHRPQTPRTGPVTLELEFLYPHTHASRKDGDYAPKLSRPDVDGAAKHFIDAMQQSGFFVDDAQIVTLTLSKRYHSQPAIIVSCKSFR